MWEAQTPPIHNPRRRLQKLFSHTIIMQYYTFRFDVAHNRVDRKMLKKWLKQFPKYMLAEETTTKEHYQGLIYTDKNIETVRRHRPFPLTGSQYSLSVCRKLEEYQSYLTKENLIAYSGYTELEIAAIPKWVEPEKAAKSKKDTFLQKLVSTYKGDCSMEDLDRHLWANYKSDIRSFDRSAYLKIMNGLILQFHPRASNNIKKFFFSDIKYQCQLPEHIKQDDEISDAESEDLELDDVRVEEM